MVFGFDAFNQAYACGMDVYTYCGGRIYCKNMFTRLNHRGNELSLRGKGVEENEILKYVIVTLLVLIKTFKNVHSIQTSADLSIS